MIESNDLTAVGKGLDMSWKLDGGYAPEKIDFGGQIASIHATIKELKEYKRGQKRSACNAEKTGPAGRKLP